MPLPEHCVAPGEQTPVHAPETHAWFVQGTTVPNPPSESQVSTPLPEQYVDPGRHLQTGCPETSALCKPHKLRCATTWMTPPSLVKGNEQVCATHEVPFGHSALVAQS
jgi:hypothetical protein